MGSFGFVFGGGTSFSIAPGRKNGFVSQKKITHIGLFPLLDARAPDAASKDITWRVIGRESGNSDQGSRDGESRMREVTKDD